MAQPAKPPGISLSVPHSRHAEPAPYRCFGSEAQPRCRKSQRVSHGADFPRALWHSSDHKTIRFMSQAGQAAGSRLFCGLLQLMTYDMDAPSLGRKPGSRTWPSPGRSMESQETSYALRCQQLKILTSETGRSVALLTRHASTD